MTVEKCVSTRGGATEWTGVDMRTPFFLAWFKLGLSKFDEKMLRDHCFLLSTRIATDFPSFTIQWSVEGVKVIVKKSTVLLSHSFVVCSELGLANKVYNFKSRMNKIAILSWKRSFSNSLKGVAPRSSAQTFLRLKNRGMNCKTLFIPWKRLLWLILVSVLWD